MFRDWERRDIMKCLLTPVLIIRQVDSVKGDLASSKLHNVAVKQTRESCLFSWPPGFTVISSIFTAFVPGGATSWPAVKMNNWCKDGFHKLLVFCTVLLWVVRHVSAVLVQPGVTRCDNLFHKQQTGDAGGGTLRYLQELFSAKGDRISLTPIFTLERI